MAIPSHPIKNRVWDNDAGRKLLDKTRAPLDEMPTTSFTSSNVHSALYDFGARELFVRYLRAAKRDAIYQYDNVSASVWNGLVRAESKGSYINSNIAFDFRYTQINASDIPEQQAAQVPDPTLRAFVMGL